MIDLKLPEVGQRYNTSFNISKEMVQKFSEFSKDDNPIHVSIEGAYDYGFKNPVCHGAILLSEISRIIGTELPGYGALWSDLNISFVSPVFWGETVDIDIEVIQKSDSLGVIKLKILVMKGSKKVLTGTAKVLCLNLIKRRLPMLAVFKRCALVTGGSRGLGLSIVKQLIIEGYNVVTISRKSSSELIELQEIFPEKIRSIYCDLNDFEELKAEIRNTSKEFMPINIVIHAASPLPKKTNLVSIEQGTIDEYLNIYVKSLIEILSACSSGMKECKYGRIITIGTSYILGNPPQGMYPYVIGKEALWGLTKCLSVDMGRFGITANMVSPSMMLTDMTNDIANNVKCSEAEKNPMNRLVELSEVTNTVLFLCGEGGSFINGTNIPVTGGCV